MKKLLRSPDIKNTKEFVDLEGKHCKAPAVSSKSSVSQSPRKNVPDSRLHQFSALETLRQGPDAKEIVDPSGPLSTRLVGVADIIKVTHVRHISLDIFLSRNILQSVSIQN